MLFVLSLLVLIVCFKNLMCQIDIEALSFTYKSESN